MKKYLLLAMAAGSLVLVGCGGEEAPTTTPPIPKAPKEKPATPAAPEVPKAPAVPPAPSAPK